jgi:hypothetical protein
MSIFKKLFQKKESSCCDVKIEEVKGDTHVPSQEEQKSSCCK